MRRGIAAIIIAALGLLMLPGCAESAEHSLKEMRAALVLPQAKITFLSAGHEQEIVMYTVVITREAAIQKFVDAMKELGIRVKKQSGGLTWSCGGNYGQQDRVELSIRFEYSYDENEPVDSEVTLCYGRESSTKYVMQTFDHRTAEDALIIPGAGLTDLWAGFISYKTDRTLTEILEFFENALQGMGCREYGFYFEDAYSSWYGEGLVIRSTYPTGVAYDPCLTGVYQNDRLKIDVRASDGSANVTIQYPVTLKQEFKESVYALEELETMFLPEGARLVNHHLVSFSSWPEEEKNADKAAGWYRDVLRANGFEVLGDCFVDQDGGSWVLTGRYGVCEYFKFLIGDNYVWQYFSMYL